MRKVTAVLMVVPLLAACTGSDTDHVSTTTTSGDVIATTTTSRVTTTQVATTTTTPAPAEPNDGNESIGITDKVTIVVTDPGDN